MDVAQWQNYSLRCGRETIDHGAKFLVLIFSNAKRKERREEKKRKKKQRERKKMKCEAWVLFVLETQDGTKGLWLGE